MQAAVAALPWLSAGASVLSGITQMQTQKYQAAVTARNSEIAAANTAKEAAASAEDMAQRDRDATAQIAEMSAAMDASGLATGGGTMLLRRRGLESLADRDRERLASKRATAIEDGMQQSASLSADAAAMRGASKFGFFTTAMSGLTSYLSGAETLDKFRTNQSRQYTLSHQG